jgi:hypothetical protein
MVNKNKFPAKIVDFHKGYSGDNYTHNYQESNKNLPLVLCYEERRDLLEPNVFRVVSYYFLFSDFFLFNEYYITRSENGKYILATGNECVMASPILFGFVFNNIL